MKKFIAIILCICAVSLAAPAPTYAEVIKGGADSSCEKGFFGMRPWYAGLATRDGDNRCVIGEPASGDDQGISDFTWTVILNILFDLFSVLGYVSLAFIILGGYWFLRSGGDPTLTARGKKTIQAAVIGTVLALLATVITNFFTMVLTSS